MPLRFSIITAVRNRADTIASTMASVQGQSWGNVEHIVVDGGSTDGTLAVLEQYRSGIARLIGGPDAGAYDAMNKGLRHAMGDVVGFMHSDDEYASPDVLATVAKAFEDPAVGAVYGDLVYVSRRDPSHVVRYWRAGAYSRAKLARGWMPPHPTLYVRRELYERFGGFDTRFRIAADYDYMLRLLWKHGIGLAYIPQVLVRMRTGGISNRSLFTLLQKSFEDFTALRQNQLGGVKALLLKNMTKLPQFVLREPLGLPAGSRRSL
jgi:glycosyltransferase involved in cell wall biosynthesis